MRNKKNTRKKVALILGSFLLLFFLFASINGAKASNPIVIGSGEGESSTFTSKYKTGGYELNDLVRLGLRVAQIIFGVVGSLALLMFVYGGVAMLISAGNSEKVSSAKKILTAAVIGLVIVFGSYLIVEFVLNALGFTGSSWSSLPE